MNRNETLFHTSKCLNRKEMLRNLFFFKGNFSELKPTCFLQWRCPTVSSSMYRVEIRGSQIESNLMQTSKSQTQFLASGRLFKSSLTGSSQTLTFEPGTIWCLVVPVFSPAPNVSCWTARGQQIELGGPSIRLACKLGICFGRRFLRSLATGNSYW